MGTEKRVASPVAGITMSEFPLAIGVAGGIPWCPS